MTSSYWRFYNFFIIFHCFWITSMKVVLHFFNITFIYLLQLFIKLTSFFLKILYLVEQSFAPNFTPYICLTTISLQIFVEPKFHSIYLFDQNFLQIFVQSISFPCLSFIPVHETHTIYTSLGLYSFPTNCRQTTRWRKSFWSNPKDFHPALFLKQSYSKRDLLNHEIWVISGWLWLHVV